MNLKQEIKEALHNIKNYPYIYLLAIMHVVVLYSFLFIFLFINKNIDNNPDYKYNYTPLLFPVIMGIINLIVIIIGRKRISREKLLNCAVLIKYSLIPFYIVGAYEIVVFLMMTFVPVVFMVFVGPTMAIFLSVVGWVALIASAPYSVGYIVKANKEGIHGKIISVIATILQFFFIVDVISIMVLTLKEKKHVKLTVFLLALFGLGIIGIIGYEIINIISYIF